VAGSLLIVADFVAKSLVRMLGDYSSRSIGDGVWPTGVWWFEVATLGKKRLTADVPSVVHGKLRFGQGGRNGGEANQTDGVVSTVLVVTVWIKQQRCGHRAASFWVQTQA
jgi:hypothetical protein